MNLLTAKMVIQRFHGLSYMEALKVAEHSEGILAQMDVHDPAWARFNKERYDMYRLCEAHDELAENKQNHHLVEFCCIISYDKGSVTKEVTYWINKNVNPRDYVKAAQEQCVENLHKAKVKHDVWKDLEIVPA